MSNTPETDTPETDAAWTAESGNGLNEVRDLSRKLERERDQFRKDYLDMKRERDQWRECSVKLADALWKAIRNELRVNSRPTYRALSEFEKLK